MTTIFLMTSEKRIIRLICSQKFGGGYAGEESIFDRMTSEDIIIAFFPCTRFETRICLAFRGENFIGKSGTAQEVRTDEERLLYSMKLQNELTELYNLLCMLVILVNRKGLRMIIENPYHADHYLVQRWCIKPKVIDMDRTKNGDYYKKPTQYFFINCEPKKNMIFEMLEPVEKKTITKERNQVKRSLMHPQYARRFIKQFIL